MAREEQPPDQVSNLGPDTEYAKNTMFQLVAGHRNSTRSSAYTSAMFSETRYAMNGDLRVAYRTSREGPRDLVFVSNWFTCWRFFRSCRPFKVGSRR